MKALLVLIVCSFTLLSYGKPGDGKSKGKKGKPSNETKNSDASENQVKKMIKKYVKGDKWDEFYREFNPTNTTCARNAIKMINRDVLPKARDCAEGGVKKFLDPWDSFVRKCRTKNGTNEELFNCFKEGYESKVKAKCRKSRDYKEIKKAYDLCLQETSVSKDNEKLTGECEDEGSSIDKIMKEIGTHADDKNKYKGNVKKYVKTLMKLFRAIKEKNEIIYNLEKDLFSKLTTYNKTLKCDPAKFIEKEDTPSYNEEDMVDDSEKIKLALLKMAEVLEKNNEVDKYNNKRVQSQYEKTNKEAAKNRKKK